MEIKKIIRNISQIKIVNIDNLAYNSTEALKAFYWNSFNESIGLSTFK